MRKIISKFHLLSFFLLVANSVWSQTEKSRLIIMADMGNEPDEIQQIVQLLMYSNEIDIEGLIAVTGTCSTIA